jgi:hypothetical protein
MGILTILSLKNRKMTIINNINMLVIDPEKYKTIIDKRINIDQYNFRESI